MRQKHMRILRRQGVNSQILYSPVTALFPFGGILVKIFLSEERFPMVTEKSRYVQRDAILQEEAELFNDPAFQRDFTKLMECYRGALKVASTQLEVLEAEIRSSYTHQPIHFMESRLKSPESLFGKLRKKGFEVSMGNIQRITDIAGIRVVCSYIQDIYDLYALIRKSECFEILRVRDYIQAPKPNGYRSLHLVAAVRVHLSEGTLKLPVEVQLRSIAMDLWASLEHELRYKSERTFSGEDEQKLFRCAQTLSVVDSQMQELFLHEGGPGNP